jgi:hypothetical protein
MKKNPELTSLQNSGISAPSSPWHCNVSRKPFPHQIHRIPKRKQTHDSFKKDASETVGSVSRETHISQIRIIQQTSSSQPITNITLPLYNTDKMKEYSEHHTHRPHGRPHHPRPTTPRKTTEPQNGVPLFCLFFSLPFLPSAMPISFAHLSKHQTPDPLPPNAAAPVCVRVYVCVYVCVCVCVCVSPRSHTSFNKERNNNH